MAEFLVGLLLSGVIGAVAYWRGSLSQSGVLGAIITGTIAFTAGLPFAVILILFFVTSSILSKISSPQKENARQQFDKGETRDFWQVMANGGIATIVAILYLLTDNADWWVLYMVAFAAATADTWGTEIGTLIKQTPRSILTLEPVDAGASGGVTLAGTLAGVAGALMIGLAGLAVSDIHVNMTNAEILELVAVAGVVGSLFDSLLGATLQAMYWCEDRQKLTEKTTCNDDTPAKLVRGWTWINNDVVNASSISFAVGIGGVIEFLL